MATWPGPGCGSSVSATLVVLASMAGVVMITAFISQLPCPMLLVDSYIYEASHPDRLARRRQHGCGGGAARPAGGRGGPPGDGLGLPPVGRHAGRPLLVDGPVAKP